MPRAYILTPWTGTHPANVEGDDVFRPLFADHFPGVDWEDASHQLNVPVDAAYTILVTADRATLAAIDRDPNFVILSDQATQAESISQERFDAILRKAERLGHKNSELVKFGQGTGEGLVAAFKALHGRIDAEQAQKRRDTGR